MKKILLVLLSLVLMAFQCESDEPCKSLISDVKLIPKENVYKIKSGVYCLINQIEVIDAEIVANKKIN